jgi:2-methylaconitate cis-trans-isomerase PrpF
MSSAIRLRAAMMVFPPLMQTAVDVNGLLGMHVVEVRIQQLEAQMEKMAKPEPSLLFLAAFIKANSGEMLSAADVAAKLLEVSKDSVHQAYAHSLLRRVGREASSQPSVTPAEGVLLPSMAPTTEP